MFTELEIYKNKEIYFILTQLGEAGACFVLLLSFPKQLLSHAITQNSKKSADFICAALSSLECTSEKEYYFISHLFHELCFKV